MKIKRMFIVALAMGLFTVTTIQAQDKTDKVSKNEMMSKEMYVCPMHKNEKSNKSGKCSQCGMDMKNMNMKKGNMMHGNMMHRDMMNNKMKDKDRSEMKMESMSSDMAKAYICPMKCEGEKTYEKVGDCPECGMAMIKMDKKKEGDDNEHKH